MSNGVVEVLVVESGEVVVGGGSQPKSGRGMFDFLSKYFKGVWGGRELAGELVFFNVMGEEALEFF